ncbi:MAG TPA: type VII secretion target [Jatrophihabitans sp.]|jgi:hypothetical protein
MTCNHFHVTTAALRSVAGGLGEHADTAGAIAGKARAAEVDTISWGALGLGLGLHDGYASARTSADRSIGEVQAFLTAARTAVEASARDYDAADEAAAGLFSGISSTTDGGS